MRALNCYLRIKWIHSPGREIIETWSIFLLCSKVFLEVLDEKTILLLVQFTCHDVPSLENALHHDHLNRAPTRTLEDAELRPVHLLCVPVNAEKRNPEHSRDLSDPVRRKRRLGSSQCTKTPRCAHGNQILQPGKPGERLSGARRAREEPDRSPRRRNPPPHGDLLIRQTKPSECENLKFRVRQNLLVPDRPRTALPEERSLPNNFTATQNIFYSYCAVRKSRLNALEHEKAKMEPLCANYPPDDDPNAVARLVLSRWARSALPELRINLALGKIRFEPQNVTR